MKTSLSFVVLFMYCSMSFAQSSSSVDSLIKENTEAIKILKKIHLSGYFQPEFQIAESKGVKNPGRDFEPNVDKRFIMRRARLKVAYNSKPFEMVLVTENTEGAFALHDVYASYTFEKLGLKYTAGLFPRPFGFEEQYSSANHEGPERARFSSTLLPTEADLGCKLSYFNVKPFTFEVGVFNGTATGKDFDSYKDIVARIGFDQKINSSNLSGGVSFYHGGIIQGTNKLFKTENVNNSIQFVLQDTLNHTKGSSALRQYLGADLQYSFKTTLGQTTLRAEWMSGTQPGSISFTDSPKLGTTLPTFDTYTRKFNALTTYFLHKIGETNLQLLVKYDWYDPNTKADEKDFVAGSNLNATDLKYSTVGLGLNYYYHNIYIMVYYDIIKNEKAANVVGFEKDIKDNVLTIISPKQRVKQFQLTLLPNPKVESDFQLFYDQKLLSKERKDLVNETISYYQTASEMLKKKKYQK